MEIELENQDKKEMRTITYESRKPMSQEETKLQKEIFENILKTNTNEGIFYHQKNNRDNLRPILKSNTNLSFGCQI